MQNVIAAIIASIATVTIGTTSLFAAKPRVYQQQPQPQKPKFVPAPPNAKGVRQNTYEVVFVEQVRIEDFERELQRVLRQYNAELANTDNLGPDTQNRIPTLRWAVLHMPEIRAKQLAEDSLVIEVAQVYEPEVLIEPVTPVPAPGSPVGRGRHYPPDKKNVRAKRKRP